MYQSFLGVLTKGRTLSVVMYRSLNSTETCLPPEHWVGKEKRNEQPSDNDIGRKNGRNTVFRTPGTSYQRSIKTIHLWTILCLKRETTFLAIVKITWIMIGVSSVGPSQDWLIGRKKLEHIWACNKDGSWGSLWTEREAASSMAVIGACLFMPGREKETITRKH